MSHHSKREYLKVMHDRYRRAGKSQKQSLLDEVCQVCGYHRKHAIRLLNQVSGEVCLRRNSHRRFTYSPTTLSILTGVWRVAGYPWSVRLKVLLHVWMPWIKLRYPISAEIERQLYAISPRQIDRRLQTQKRKIRKRIYGRTKPGTLLKHKIPIRTTHWDVTTPGYVEVDLVSHSGNSASGTFIFSLNLTDIFSGWVETRAVMGKGYQGILEALEEIRLAVPFDLKGIDSDNGGEFINDHLFRYCQHHRLHFTRGRPYKKDDNAHIEQKNWTHVRKVLGWDRYDSPRALQAINAFYRGPWRVMMNLFQPSTKLMRKVRKGSSLVRQYDVPQTPLDRLLAVPTECPETLKYWQAQRMQNDPFELAERIEKQLEAIWKLANSHLSPHSG